MLKGEYLLAKTGSGPVETFTIHVCSLGDPLFVPHYLAMHSRQSILYREPKIYTGIKSFNNPESYKYNLKKIIIAIICIIGLNLCFNLY